MPVKIGTATNYKDLLDKVLAFITSRGESATPVYTGTGNGTLSEFSALPLAPSETWTLQVTSGTKAGSANYGAAIAGDSPVLHWRFNETTGTTAADNTGNGRTGTISGSPTLGSTGLLSVDTDKAITFDGVNDKVQSAAIAAVQLTGDAALEVIINPSSITGQRFIAGVGSAGTANANNYLISLWLVNGYLKIYHEYGAGNIEQVTTHVFCAANRKHHIVLSRDNVNKVYTLFVGGIARHTFEYLFPASDGTSSYFLVGTDADGLYPFAGLIDEPALYNAQISAATAKTHANAALAHEPLSVTGTLSGVAANAYVGVPYQNAFIDFLIEDGSTDFIANDQWTIAITASAMGAQAWSINRREVDKVFLQGPGLSGTDEIYAYIETYEDTSLDYYNWELGAADGYNPLQPKTGQPNASPAVWLPLWNQPIPFWLIANGRRVILIAKVESTYHNCIFGLYLPFATPLQFPYPMEIAGSTSVRTNRFSNSSTDTRMIGASGLLSHYIRNLEGGWVQVSGRADGLSSLTDVVQHPYAAFAPSRVKLTSIREGLNGEYPLTPISFVDLGAETTTQNPLLSSLTKGVLGEMDGCYHISGFANASENIAIDQNSIQYLVVPSVFRSGIADYMAVRLT